jgi:hypothetical protein
MRRLFALAGVVALLSLLRKELPAIRRYIKIERM